MSKNKRTTILEAASEIVETNGILDLTLESAAEKAGVSKGGLLYHFPSKDALIEGMVHFHMQHYIDSTRAGAEQDMSQTGKWTRAFIRETFQQSTGDKRLDSGLIAAAVVNPSLLKPIQDAYQEWQNHIEQDALDPVKATILRLAVDGLWFSEIFDLAPLTDDRREQVLEQLIQLTREE